MSLRRSIHARRAGERISVTVTDVLRSGFSRRSFFFRNVRGGFDAIVEIDLVRPVRSALLRMCAQ